MGLFSISYVFKKLHFPILLHSFSSVQFLEQFSSPFHPICHFFSSNIPQPRFHKSYPQSKTFLNIRAAPSSVIFCSNAVLITTPSSSMHFFSFFDVLWSVPTTTGMSLMLLMFHILLISVFSSWYLSIFYFSFSLTLMFPGIEISIMAQLVSFLFTTTISGFLALISLSHWIITSHKISTSSFLTTTLEHVHTVFKLYFPHQFLMNYSCNIIVPSLVLLLCQLFTFAHNMRYCFTCHTLYKMVIGLFYVSCVSRSFFELLAPAQHTTWLLFQLSSQLFSASTMFLFHLLFVAFLLQTVPRFFCFSIVYYFPSPFCLNSYLLSVSLCSIVSAAFTTSVNS